MNKLGELALHGIVGSGGPSEITPMTWPVYAKTQSSNVGLCYADPDYQWAPYDEYISPAVGTIYVNGFVVTPEMDYIAGGTSNLIVWDNKDGVEQKSVSTPASVISIVVDWDMRVMYVGLYDDTVKKYDVDTFIEIVDESWPVSFDGRPVAIAVNTNGDVIVGLTNSKVYKYTAVGGLIWSVIRATSIMQIAVDDNDVIYCGADYTSGPPTFYALRDNDGSELWGVNPYSYRGESISVCPDGEIILCCYEKGFVKVNPDTGVTSWERASTAMNDAKPALDGIIVEGNTQYRFIQWDLNGNVIAGTGPNFGSYDYPNGMQIIGMPRSSYAGLASVETLMKPIANKMISQYIIN